MMLNTFSLLKKKIPPISLGMFNLIVVLWLSIALNISFYQKIAKLTPYSGLKAQLFLAATVVVVIALYNVLLQLFHWRWNAKLLASALIFIGGFSAYFVSSLGAVISPDQIQNIMQSDAREMRDLTSVRFILWSIFLVILPIGIISQIPIQKEPAPKLLLKKLLHIAGSFAILAGLLFVFYVDYAAIFREHRDLKGMLSPQNTIASTLSYYRHRAPKQDLPLVAYGTDAHRTLPASPAQKPKLMVLVVGETARAESFSLNGYSRNTNPELAKLDVINFSKVSSCGTATAVSVPCMFSGMPRKDYDDQLASHREGLLDIAQRAGYKVTWIDNNSGCKGACDRVEQWQFPAELQKKWCASNGECHDEILVDALKQYIAGIPEQDAAPRLIVLHQMGSHGPAYYERSTAPFQPFKPSCDTNAIQGCSQAELINSYDNSIVYTDHVLSGLIHALQDDPKYQAGFWYLSDHGESTGEHGMYLHGAPYAIAPAQQTHVPMLMWFSDGYQKHFGVDTACLAGNRAKPYSHDNLFHSLLGLLDVQTREYDAAQDLFSTCRKGA